MKINVNFIFACLVFFIVFQAGCRKGPQKPPPPPAPVQVAEIIQKDVPFYVDSFGYMRALYNVDIVSQVTGKIVAVNFKQGQMVKKNDILFTIDKSSYLAELAKSKALLKEDEANLKLKTDIVNKDKQAAEKHAIAAQTYEQYVTEMYYTQAQVQTDKAVIQQAQINLDYCDIRSPIDGITGKRQVDPGNVVSANTGPTLVNVKFIDTLYVDFTIPERYLEVLRDSLAKGNLKTWILVEYLGITEDPTLHAGELKFLNNCVDEATGTISLRAEVKNEKHTLWPGQFVKLRLVMYTQKNAILAPTDSVQVGQNGKYMFVVNGDTADLKLVETGELQQNYTVKDKDGKKYLEIAKNAPNHIVIEKGDVKPGDKAVIVGQMGLTPGRKVRIIKSTETSSPGGNAETAVGNKKNKVPATTNKKSK